MSAYALTKELATTLMLLQDTYGAVRNREEEMEALKEELRVKQLEIDSLNARLLLNQIMQYVKQPETESTSEEYQP
jgi:hypothetical protein